MSFRASRRCSGAWLALACAASFPSQAHELSGTVAATTDYVFRGISQTQGELAWQGSLRVDAAGGFYGSVWASRVDFASAPAARAEIDYVAGWRHALGDDWAGDINVTWFTYAGARELDYVELIATATWRERTWLMAGASRDVFATGRTGIYAHAGTRVPLNDATRIEFAGGYYWLDRAYGRSYLHAQAMVATQVHPRVELRLLAHFTDRNARTVFGEPADPRLEASLQASF